MDHPVLSSPDNLQSDMNYQKKLEDEHLRLQRQVRMIQADRNDSSQGVHPQFRRHDLLMRTLKGEYDNLKMDLKIAGSGAHKKNDRRMKMELKRSVLCMTQTEKECEGGVTLMEQLEGLQLRNSKEMLRLRALVNANRGQLKKRRVQSENRLISTENKLETAMLRVNTVQFEISKIREEIEHMLNDRANFNQAWTKILAALSRGKKFLNDLFESSTLAYDQRDEWCTKLKSILEKGKMDQTLQVQEMRDLQKACDHEMKMFNFLAKKGVMRVNKQEEHRQEERKQKEEEEVKEKIQLHYKILEEIYDYTEMDEIQCIIYNFKRVEVENFSVYKTVTELCAENIVLERDLGKMRQELEDRRDWMENKIAREKDNVKKLETEVEEQTKRTDVLRKKKHDTDQLVHSTMTKIEEMFKMLNCSLQPFQNLLGDKKPSVYQYNLTLSLITEKIKQYIEYVYYIERCQKKTKTTSSRLKKYTVYAEPPEIFVAQPINVLVPDDPCPNCVEARWLSRFCDTPEVPFDKEMSLKALAELRAEPAFMRSDRVHALADCRSSRSRALLARRYQL